MPHYNFPIHDFHTYHGLGSASHGQSFESTLLLGDSFSFIVENGPNPAIGLAALAPLANGDPAPLETISFTYQKVEWTYDEHGGADLTAYYQNPDTHRGDSITVLVDDPSVQSLRDALLQLADSDFMT